MSDLTAKYLGLTLPNPVIVASSPLTGTIERLAECEKAGAGAVVLKSIFEEQINSQVWREVMENEDLLGHSDYASYFENIAKEHYVQKGVDLLRAAKRDLSIPVIASVNCVDEDTWPEYIKAFEDAGADAIELNYYPIASDAETDGRTVEKRAVSFLRKAKEAATKPVSLKIGYKYSSLANIIRQFDLNGADGLVLFNRFFRPDIDIESLTASRAADPFSGKGEYAEALRWTALMSAEINCDICAATGIHDGETVVKLLLAGAAACQVCTAPMKDISSIKAMTGFLSEWMDRKGFATIDDFKGKLAQENIEKGGLWERTQYVKGIIGGDI